MADEDVAGLAARGDAETARLSDVLVRDTSVAYAFIAPAFFLLLFLVAYPFVLSVWFSLSDARIGETGAFVGLENFERRGAPAVHRAHRAQHAGLVVDVRAALQR